MGHGSAVGPVRIQHDMRMKTARRRERGYMCGWPCSVHVSVSHRLSVTSAPRHTPVPVDTPASRAHTRAHHEGRGRTRQPRSATLARFIHSHHRVLAPFASRTHTRSLPVHRHACHPPVALGAPLTMRAREVCRGLPPSTPLARRKPPARSRGRPRRSAATRCANLVGGGPRGRSSALRRPHHRASCCGRGCGGCWASS